ncbi:hypothetical protein BDV32DRAFT_66088 [Aspergillus pseudonomiae]|nr:hypothetical protein BDV32DRAFT_66088 [Aspergillus pseudonomiae]
MPLYLHPPLLFLPHPLTRNSSPLASFSPKNLWESLRIILFFSGYRFRGFFISIST